MVSNRRLILETDYVCSFPWEVIQPDVSSGLLRVLDVALPQGFGPVGISLRKGGAPSRTAEALLDALRASA